MSTEVTIKHSVADMLTMAKAMANSNLFGMKNADQALALMLVAQAEGLHPASAAMEFNIIQGKPSRTSESILTRFQKAGGKVEWHEYTDEKVSATFSHPQGSPVLIEWDMERARNCGLAGKDNWKKWPRNMLACRAISEGCRRVFPGSTGGLYTPDEVEEFGGQKTINTTASKPLGIEAKLGIDTEPSQLDSVLVLVENAKNLEELNKAGQYAKSLNAEEKEILRPKYEAKLEALKEPKNEL